MEQSPETYQNPDMALFSEKFHRRDHHVMMVVDKNLRPETTTQLSWAFLLSSLNFDTNALAYTVST